MGLAYKYDNKVSEVMFKWCGTPGYIAPEILKYNETD